MAGGLSGLLQVGNELVNKRLLMDTRGRWELQEFIDRFSKNWTAQDPFVHSVQTHVSTI